MIFRMIKCSGFEHALVYRFYSCSRVKCEAPVTPRKPGLEDPVTPRKPALEDTVSTHTQQNDSIIIIE